MVRVILACIIRFSRRRTALGFFIPFADITHFRFCRTHISGRVAVIPQTAGAICHDTGLTFIVRLTAVPVSVSHFLAGYPAELVVLITNATQPVVGLCKRIRAKESIDIFLLLRGVDSRKVSADAFANHLGIFPVHAVVVYRIL